MRSRTCDPSPRDLRLLSLWRRVQVCFSTFPAPVAAPFPQACPTEEVCLPSSPHPLMLSGSISRKSVEKSPTSECRRPLCLLRFCFLTRAHAQPLTIPSDCSCLCGLSASYAHAVLQMSRCLRPTGSCFHFYGFQGAGCCDLGCLIGQNT